MKVPQKNCVCMCFGSRAKPATVATHLQNKISFAPRMFAPRAFLYNEALPKPVLESQPFFQSSGSREPLGGVNRPKKQRDLEKIQFSRLRDIEYLQRMNEHSITSYKSTTAIARSCAHFLCEIFQSAKKHEKMRCRFLSSYVLHIHFLYSGSGHV